MNNLTLDLLYKKISDLEKRLERYYQILKIEDELDFIIKGNYVLLSEIEKVINGNY